MSATTILYNGLNPFSGIAATPLVSLNEQMIDYGERWGLKSTVTLNGMITGDCTLFTKIVSGQNSIINSFGQDFQALQIVESGLTIFNKPTCIIKNINFADSQYTKKLPFSIEIDCYDSGFFSGVYGVLEPRNEFSFVLERDQSIRLEHTVSCRGFNTSSNNSNALQNAQNFISQFSGFNNQISPYFIQLCSGISPSLMTVSENIDRVAGTYGITETYIAEKEWPSGVLRYSTIYNSGIEDGLSTVQVNGSIKTAKNYPASFLRQRYSGFSPLSAAVECYSGITNLTDLNPLYLTSGVTEDQVGRSLSFNIAFNNDVVSQPFIDYKVTFAEDDLTSVTNAQFEGVIKARGELSQKWPLVQQFAANLNIYNLVANEYYRRGYQYFLNPDPLTQSISQNPFIGEIALGASYSDKILPPSGLSSLDYNISVSPAIEKYSAVPILNGSGNYWVSDLGYANRAIVRLEGSAVVQPGFPLQTGINTLTNYINYIGQSYVTGSVVVLDDQSIKQGNSDIGLTLAFEAQWSFVDNIFQP